MLPVRLIALDGASIGNPAGSDLGQSAGGSAKVGGGGGGQSGSGAARVASGGGGQTGGGSAKVVVVGRHSSGNNGANSGCDGAYDSGLFSENENALFSEDEAVSAVDAYTGDAFFELASPLAESVLVNAQPASASAPEPESLGLLGTGLACLGLLRRRKSAWRGGGQHVRRVWR